jgi:hypothetical protein
MKMSKLHSYAFVSDYATVFINVAADPDWANDECDDVAIQELIGIVKHPEDFRIEDVERPDEQ